MKPGDDITKEIVFTCAYPGAGKSTLIEKYKDTHFRLNRDLTGGKLETVAAMLEAEIRKGGKRFVLDNTYGIPEQRALLVQVSQKYNIPIKCLWLKTSIEDAMVNVCHRIVKAHGRLLTPDEIKKSKDPGTFPIAVLYGFRNEFVEPSYEEGFKIEEVKFVRRKSEHTNKALILDYDGTLRETDNPLGYPTKIEEVRVIKGRAQRLLKYQSEGYILLGVSNQSGVAKGELTDAAARECFAETNRQLGLDSALRYPDALLIDVAFCPHRVPPISCFCRKPGPGLGVQFIEKYKLDPAECIMVGDMKTDKTFATRCGFKYVDQSEFFK